MRSPHSKNEPYQRLLELHTHTLPYPTSENHVTLVCSAVCVACASVCSLFVSRRQVSQWVADNELVVSKYAEDLEHVDSGGRKISSDPATWVCEESGKTENLWLNLSTGKNRFKPWISKMRRKGDYSHLSSRVNGYKPLQDKFIFLRV